LTSTTKSGPCPNRRYTEAELENGIFIISHFRPEKAASRGETRHSAHTYEPTEARPRGINIAAPPSSDLSRISQQGPTGQKTTALWRNPQVPPPDTMSGRQTHDKIDRHVLTPRTWVGWVRKGYAAAARREGLPATPDSLGWRLRGRGRATGPFQGCHPEQVKFPSAQHW
jgi:hypothetical protein